MPILWDEIACADVDTAARMWCAECRRKTLFTRDMDGMPLCREHTEESEEIES